MYGLKLTTGQDGRRDLRTSGLHSCVLTTGQDGRRDLKTSVLHRCPSPAAIQTSLTTKTKVSTINLRPLIKNRLLCVGTVGDPRCVNAVTDTSLVVMRSHPGLSSDLFPGLRSARRSNELAGPPSGNTSTVQSMTLTRVSLSVKPNRVGSEVRAEAERDGKSMKRESSELLEEALDGGQRMKMPRYDFTDDALDDPPSETGDFLPPEKDTTLRFSETVVTLKELKVMVHVQSTVSDLYLDRFSRVLPLPFSYFKINTLPLFRFPNKKLALTSSLL